MARPPLPVGSYGNISTNKLPNGRYEARTRFRDYDGVTRQVRRTAKTKSAAVQELRAELVDRAAPSSDDLKPTSRLSAAIELWTEEKFPGLTDNSRRRYRDAINGHILDALGELRLNEIRPARLDRFVKDIAANTGASTAKHCKTILSQVFDMVVRYDVLTANPVNGVAGVTVTRAKQTRALTPEEFSAAREAIRAWQQGVPVRQGERRRGRPPTQDLEAILILGVQTAGRIGEILALRWSDVDLDAKTVTFRGTLHRPDVPNPKWTRKDTTKTGQILTVDLPEAALAELFRLSMREVGNVHDAVFPSANGTWRDPNNVRKALHRVLDPLGMDYITPHILRSTAATIVEREYSIREAAQQLGHAGTETTAKHYVEKTYRGPAAAAVMDAFVRG